jgi:pimeloyl-ACP methyl ester carboxylesterase
VGETHVVASGNRLYISFVTSASTRVVDVPVAGGALAVEVVESASLPVLAVHGVSSHRRLWDWLRLEAPELSLIAPDLRGRGDSVGVAHPLGLRQHADDMVAVLDLLELPRVTVCGMSLGGFVAIDLAVRYPDRVSGLVLVDGGFPMAAPPGLTREHLPALFADRIGRLGRSWASIEEFGEFFATTAPLLDPSDPVLAGYLTHDLGPDGRVRLNADALIADAGDAFFDPPDWRDVEVPTRLLHAEWSKGADSPPAYSEDAVASFRNELPALVSTRLLSNADHAATIMTKAGAAATAELLTEALA